MSVCKYCGNDEWKTEKNKLIMPCKEVIVKPMIIKDGKEWKVQLVLEVLE
jgi:hypothetical protein